MTELEAALAEAGGARAPAAWTARGRELLQAELEHGARELERRRSGTRDRPVVVAFAAEAARLAAVTPVSVALRADPDRAGERAWLLVAAAVGALVEAAELPPPARAAALDLRANALAESWLVLEVPHGAEDPAALAELAALAFELQVEGVDRLRAGAVAVPAALVGDDGDPREPLGDRHPLRVAEAVARLGGRPADAASVDEHEEAVLAVLARGGTEPTRPHDDPDSARRVARRILQRLHGMGKWGGYHTDFTHLARGFAGNDRALASEVGERLLAAGLLLEKPSVGQRHVFLNSRRAREIMALIETGELPRDLDLPASD